MKKILHIMFAVATILASCSKEENSGEQIADEREVTISAIPEVSMADEPDMKSVQTRGTVTCNRYIIELYADADYNTMVGTQQSTTDGNFTLTLERSKTYYALLWADNNASAIYDVTSLKAVTLKTGQLPAEAFYGKLTIAGNLANYDVSLKRAVAKLNLNETNNLLKGSVTVKYNQKPTFNVTNSTTSGTDVSLTKTVTLTADVTGTKVAPVTLNTNQPIYVLASTVATDVDYTFQYKYATESSPELEFTVTAPVQANYNTNIKGDFLVPDPRARAGYFYYKDRTWSRNNNATTDNPVIGIICAVNTDGYSGKIISLDEAKLAWNPDGTKVSGTEGTTDGAANTAVFTSYSGYSATKFPCVAWCVAKNTSAITGIKWYVPAIDELTAIYFVKFKIFTALGKVSGATIINEYEMYFSSTQSLYMTTLMWAYKLTSPVMQGGVDKTTAYKIRAMSAFKSTI
nr:hypothetical protein [uncultured Bacteroides sp.]